MSRIFLCDLNLQHLVGLPQAAEKRRNRLPDLEIHRAVLDLKDDIIMVIAVHRHKVVVSGSCPVGLSVSPVLLAVIYKASPYNDAAVFLNDIGEHIGTVRLGPSVCEGTGTTLGIRLYKEASECGYLLKYLRHLSLPPCDDFFIKGICTVESSDLNGRCVVEAEEKLDPISRKNLSKLCNLIEESVGDKIGCRILYINVVDHHAVDADRCDQSCIINGTLVYHDIIIFEKEGISRISSLDITGHIVPVVEHSQRIGGTDSFSGSIDGLYIASAGYGSQDIEYSVKDSGSAL